MNNKIMTKILSALLALCMVMTAFITIGVSEHDHVHADPTSTPTGTGTAIGDDDGEFTASSIRTRKYNTPEEKLASMTLKLSAYGYELWALAETGEVAIKNVKTGEILFTNPYDANQHVSATKTASATASTFEQLSSQILLEYKDSTGATKSLCSFKDSAESSQISISPVKNGISVDYIVGRLDARRVCPMTVTREFMENEVLALIEDSNDYKKIYPQYYRLYDSITGGHPQKTLDSWYKQYPILEKMEIYALNESATDYEKNKVESILKAWCPKITYEIVDQQHQITEYEAKQSVLPCFRMSIIYKVDANGLTIKLPANSIVFNEDAYSLKSITLLPYFGAGSSAEGGFTFIPDGTGSVIEFEDVKEQSVVLTGTLYGADFAYHTLPTSYTGKSEAMRFPVFGVVDNKVTETKYFIDGDDDPSNDIPYCKHSYVDTVTEPTCTEGGFTTSVCSLCSETTPGHKVVKDYKDPAHTYDEAVEGSVVVDKTTCIYLGKTTYTCTKCNDVTVVEDTEYAEHSYVGEPSGVLGITRFTCQDCGRSYLEGHSEHTLKQVGKIDASCSEGVYENIKGNVYIYENGTLTLFVRDYDVLKFVVGESITLAGGATGLIKDVELISTSKEDIKALTDAAAVSNNAMASNDYNRFKVEIEITIDDITAVADKDGVIIYSIPKHVGQGYTLYYCGECGHFEKKGFSYDEHTYKIQNDRTEAATCTTEGKTYYKCDCGAERVITSPIAHKWPAEGTITDKYILTSGIIVDESSPIPGKIQLYSFKCSDCGTELLRVKDVCKKDELGNETHKYRDSETVVVAAGDCTHYRSLRQTCYLCNTVTTVTAKSYSHKIQQQVVAPTCTDIGYTVFTCSECDVEYRGDFVDPCHTYEETVVENTCTTDGSIKYDCTSCGHSYTEVVPASHKYESTVVAPNCTEGGYTIHTCTECQYTMTDSETEPKHEWSKVIITKYPTITEQGERYYVCKKCFTKREETQPALGSGGLDYYTVKEVAPQGYVAILTEGESFVTITSNHGGPLHPYNSTYITLNPRPSDTYNLRDSLSVGADAAWEVVSERKFTGNYTLRILMVSDHEEGKYPATVSGMAAAYRDYLALDKMQTEKDIPLYLETLGATEVQKTILSFPVYLSTALTTFEDLEKISEDLKKYDITNLNFKLTGFVNGGMDSLVPNKVDFEKVVGGNEGYKEFMAYAEANGISVSTEFDFSYLHSTGLFDGYSAKKDATQTIDGRYIMKKEYNPTFQMFETTGLLSISPSVFMKFYKNLSPDLAELGYKGISASTLGSDLNSDFDEDEPYNREDSKKFIINLLAQMQKDSGDNVMVDGGNAYVYPYVSHILNMSTSGSNYLNASASVPFLSMALHSYISYAGTPTNQASNIDYEILKMIETGSNPYFILCTQNTEALKEDKNLNKYYSIAYDIWMKTENSTTETNIVDIYNRINEAIKDVQSADYTEFRHLIGERVASAEELEAYKAKLNKQIEELDAKKNKAVAAFEAAQNLYIRLLKEQRYDEADKYYDNIGTTLVAKDEIMAEYEVQKAKLEAVAGYNEDGTYNKTDYTVDDNSIAYVEYSNGVYFVLNYNNFDVTVTLNGEQITVGAMDYYKNTK